MTTLTVLTLAAIAWCMWDAGWTIGGAFWLGAGALASWLHHVGSAV